MLTSRGMSKQMHKFTDLGAERGQWWVHCCWRRPCCCSVHKTFLAEWMSTFRERLLHIFLFFTAWLDECWRSMPSNGEGCYGDHILPVGRWHGETLLWTDLGAVLLYIWNGSLRQVQPGSRWNYCQQRLTEQVCQGKTRAGRYIACDSHAHLVSKAVPWLALNLHHLFSNGAAFNTQSRRSLTSYTISRSYRRRYISRYMRSLSVNYGSVY